MNKRNVFVILIILFITTNIFSQPKISNKNIELKNLLIFDFANISQNKENSYLSKAIPDQLTLAFNRTNKFSLIEKEKIEDLLAKRKINIGEEIDFETALMVSQNVGADYAIFGKFIIIEDRIEIYLFIINVVQEDIIISDNITGNLDAKQYELIDELSMRTSYELSRNTEQYESREQLVERAYEVEQDEAIDIRYNHRINYGMSYTFSMLMYMFLKNPPADEHYGGAGINHCSSFDIGYGRDFFDINFSILIPYTASVFGKVGSTTQIFIKSSFWINDNFALNFGYLYLTNNLGVQEDLVSLQFLYEAFILGFKVNFTDSLMLSVDIGTIGVNLFNAEKASPGFLTIESKDETIAEDGKIVKYTPFSGMIDFEWRIIKELGIMLRANLYYGKTMSVDYPYNYFGANASLFLMYHLDI